MLAVPQASCDVEALCPHFGSSLFTYVSCIDLGIYTTDQVMSLRAELKATTGYGGKLGANIAAKSEEAVDVKQEVCLL